MQFSWWSTCLECSRPWVQSPRPHKIRPVMTHSCNPRTQCENRNIMNSRSSPRLYFEARLPETGSQNNKNDMKVGCCYNPVPQARLALYDKCRQGGGQPHSKVECKYHGPSARKRSPYLQCSTLFVKHPSFPLPDVSLTHSYLAPVL